MILGDRNIISAPFSVKVGDCFRLGSVGLVVSELKIPGQDELRLDAKTLQFLKDEALAFDTQEDMATLAFDEEQQINRESELEHEHDLEHSLDGNGEEHDADEPSASPEKNRNISADNAGLTNGERFICYMCYETHNTEEDSLVAPCDCRGDTRYLHVQCLQKWYQSSVCGSQAQVIRTTGNGAPACKICGSAYKSAFRRPDGRKASLLEVDSVGPYLSLVVVTKHDTNVGLFNTKFRLNFGRHANTPPHVTDEEANTVVIGRSSSCNMILDYRTVSTVHAKIHYQDGKFLLTDKRSSNGTMVYLQDPLPLSYATPLKFRMGRTTLSIQAKRGWTATLRSALGGGQPSESVNGPTALELHNLLVESRNSSMHKREQANSAAQENSFLHQRSFTIKTFNNDSSVNGNEAMDGDENDGEDGLMGGAGDEYLMDESQGQGRVSPRMRLASANMLGNISETSQGVSALNLPVRNSSFNNVAQPHSGRIRSRSNDSVNEPSNMSPRAMAASTGHHSPRPQGGSGGNASNIHVLRETFVEQEDDDDDREFQLALQASLAASLTSGGGGKGDDIMPALRNKTGSFRCTEEEVATPPSDSSPKGRGTPSKMTTPPKQPQGTMNKARQDAINISTRDYSASVHGDELSGDDENEDIPQPTSARGASRQGAGNNTIVLVEGGSQIVPSRDHSASPAVFDGQKSQAQLLGVAGSEEEYLPAAGAFALPGGGGSAIKRVQESASPVVRSRSSSGSGKLHVAGSDRKDRESNQFTNVSPGGSPSKKVFDV
eukprot:gene22095-28194_t